MNMPAHRQLPPSPADAALARDTGARLSRYVKRKGPLSLRVRDDAAQETIELPSGAVALLMEILEAMAAGRGVTVILEDAELTTVEAAEILNVSRPYIIKLLEKKAIPHRKVGKHRRVKLEDVMSYRLAIDKERESVLDELARDGQEQGMGYGH